MDLLSPPDTETAQLSAGDTVVYSQHDVSNKLLHSSS